MLAASIGLLNFTPIIGTLVDEAYAVQDPQQRDKLVAKTLWLAKSYLALSNGSPTTPDQDQDVRRQHWCMTTPRSRARQRI